MPVVPQPLILATTLKLARFSHDTMGLTFPPGAETEFYWAPPKKPFVYLVFSFTFGDYTLGEFVGGVWKGWEFWHSQEPYMKLHYDPICLSLDKIEYPHWLIVTKKFPVYIKLRNGLDITDTLDFTIWYFETTEEKLPLILELLEGEAKMFAFFAQYADLIGKIIEEYAEKLEIKI